MSTIIKTEIVIDAKAEQVWAVLTDFSKYNEWNPFIKQASGELKLNEKITIMISKMKFSPTLTTIIPSKTLIWQGKMFIKFLFDVEHRFFLEESDGKTNIKHEETFSGFLSTLFPNSFFNKTRFQFDGMNLALKNRVEAINENKNQE